MAVAWTFEQRIAAYKAEGITNIVIMPGAKTHNRDDETGRTFGPVHGVVVHHTAGVSKGMKDVIYRGVSGLPGPLSHDFLAKDGTLYVVGHGRTNHAGSVTPAVKAAIVAEQAPTNQKLRGEETVDGNDFLFGLEIENLGNGKDPYPIEQYQVAVKWAAAHARFYRWGINSIWGHKEITSRKIDPSFPMGLFRTAVRNQLDGFTPGKPATPAPKPAPVPQESATVANFYTSLARNSSEPINAQSTEKIYWTAEYQDGPADHGANGFTVLRGMHYTGTVSLTFENQLPAGVSFRAMQEIDAGGDTGEPVTDLAPGLNEYSISVTGRVPADRELYFQIINGSGEAINLIWAGVRLLSWDL